MKRYSALRVASSLQIMVNPAPAKVPFSVPGMETHHPDNGRYADWTIILKERVVA